MTLITYILIALIAIVSFQGFNSPEMINKMTFSPYQVKHHNQYKRFFSHLLIHADWGHLFFNMFSFYFFGSYMEMVLKMTYGPELGTMHFLVLFLVGGLFATLWPYVRNQDNPNYQSLGASGAVSSIIFAFVMWSPNEPLYIMALFPIKAYIFGPLYLAIEYYAFKKGRSNIAHDAHIGGAIFGIVYILYINIDKGKEFFAQILAGIS